MSPRRQVPLHEYPARRIALVKPSALGDIVHTLPVLTALRRRYPTAHITWVVNHSYEPLLRGHPDLSNTLPFDRGARRGGWLSALTAWGRFAKDLRDRRFDLLIDLQGLLRTGLMCLASGATRRVGLCTAREGAAWCYTDVIPVPDAESLHAVDRYWLIAEALGAGDAPKTFRLPEFPAEQNWVSQTLNGLPRPWLAVGVGARWQTKRWPPGYFAALVRRAQLAHGGTAIFVGAAEDTAAAEAAAARISGPRLLLTGTTTLPQLAALLSRADVMLANDTGPLHLAAALGCPVVAPYTCTRARLTGPYNNEAGAVPTRVACAGSLLRRCPRMECMSELTPDRLWPALEGVLLRWQSDSRSA